MKSCRISLVLLCFLFAVIVSGLSADESASLSNAAIVLPFKVGPIKEVCVPLIVLVLELVLVLDSLRSEREISRFENH